MTTTLQTIESKDYTISTLFNDFYTVPSYQREYVWKDEQVEQLLTDIYDEFADSDTQTSSEYFIGSIVALLKSDDTFELIDGQQRTTTLFLILCAVRDHLKAKGANPPETLIRQIASSSIDSRGEDVYRYRITLQYEDSMGVLEHIGSGDNGVEGFTETTRSVANILNAYRVIREYLESQFGDDAPAIRLFYAFFTRNVKLIRVKTVSMAHALKVFETINDRGMGLDSMDLLKNLLFMHATPSDFEILKNRWKEIVDTLYRAKEKPLRFLRYYVFATYDVERIKEDEIYSWFTKHKSEVGYERDPLGFAEHLLAAAKAYVTFLQGKSVDGSINRYLDNIRYLSGAARQHLILLLAGRHLSDDAFVLLSKDLENLFAAYIIAREPTKEFERTFARWARDLREARDLTDVQGFIERHFLKAKQDLASRFSLAFRELRQDDLQKYRLKYVLAKLTQFVDEMAYGSQSHVTDLGVYLKNTIHIEHILPQTPNEEVKKAFDKPEAYFDYVYRFGNLTLLENPIDSSIGRGLFEKKRRPYTMSNLLLTKSLGQVVGVGQNTAYTRAAGNLEVFETWTSDDVERRQRMLSRLANKVWEMPQA